MSPRAAGAPTPGRIPHAQCTHPVCVVDDNGVGVAVVGRVCIGVIAEPGQHGGNLGHVPQHIPRDVASPLGESFQVHGLDDLVCGSFNPGERGQAGWGVGSREGGGGGTWYLGPTRLPSTVRRWASHLASAYLLCTMGLRAQSGKPAEKC